MMRPTFFTLWHAFCIYRDVINQNNTHMNHISSERLEDLLEQFMHENPYGDSRELAEFMFNQGWESGRDSNAKSIYE